MPGPWIIVDDLLTALSSGLKKEKSILKSYWTDIAGRCVTRGYMDVRNVLIAKGYTLAQLDAWDDRVQYNLDQSLFWAYVEGGGPSTEEFANFKYLNRADQFKKTPDKDVAIMLGGKMTAPGGTCEEAAIATGSLLRDRQRCGELIQGIDMGTVFGLRVDRYQGRNAYGDRIQEYWYGSNPEESF